MREKLQEALDREKNAVIWNRWRVTKYCDILYSLHYIRSNRQNYFFTVYLDVII